MWNTWRKQGLPKVRAKQDKVAICEGCPCSSFSEVGKWLLSLLVLSLGTD